MEAWLTHGALRTRIKKVRGCVHDHDQPRLRRELDQLWSALAEHLAIESSELAGLPAQDSLRIRGGQYRILSTLRTLRADLDTSYDRDRESLVMELDTLFELQEDAERRSFRDQGLRVTANESDS